MTELDFNPIAEKKAYGGHKGNRSLRLHELSGRLRQFRNELTRLDTNLDGVQPDTHIVHPVRQRSKIKLVRFRL